MKPDIFEGDAKNFQDRVIWVVRHFAGKPPRYKQLEEHFEISARKWQNMCNRVQQPTIEMLTALATAYPKYSEWLLTGKVSAKWQQDPSIRRESGEIDLSVLDDPDEGLNTLQEGENTLAPEEINELVEAFFTQLSRKKRKQAGPKNGNKES